MDFIYRLGAWWQSRAIDERAKYEKSGRKNPKSAVVLFLLLMIPAIRRATLENTDGILISAQIFGALIPALGFSYLLYRSWKWFLIVFVGFVALGIGLAVTVASRSN